MMKKTIVLINMLLIVFFLNNCQKEIITTREYPRIILNGISQDDNGVTFRASILSEGNSDIMEKGFVWGAFTPNINSSRVYVDGNNIREYHATAEKDFQAGNKYYVSAFVRTKNFIVYSQNIEFISTFSSPAPQIDDFSPKTASIGDTIKITGDYFSFITYNNHVAFRSSGNIYGYKYAEVISCSDTLLIIKVPEIPKTEYNITIRVNEKSITSQEKFICKNSK